MLPDDTRRKIENITSGAILKRESDHCTTIRNLLCRRFTTSTTVKKDFEGKAIAKKEQALIIEAYCNNHELWFTEFPPQDRYLTRGGEAKVYLHSDNRHVIKFNDGMYYA